MSKNLCWIRFNPERIHDIWIGKDSSDFSQKVNYENLPKYCSGCKHIGHDVDSCYAKGRNEMQQRHKTEDPQEDLRVLLEKKKGKKIVEDNKELRESEIER